MRARVVFAFVNSTRFPNRGFQTLVFRGNHADKRVADIRGFLSKRALLDGAQVLSVDVARAARLCAAALRLGPLPSERVVGRRAAARAQGGRRGRPWRSSAAREGLPRALLADLPGPAPLPEPGEDAVGLGALRHTLPVRRGGGPDLALGAARVPLPRHLHQAAAARQA